MSWEPQILWAALNFTPHPGQSEILQKVDAALHKHSGAQRFLDASTGRQWGKTLTAGAALWMGLLMPPDEFGPPAVKVIADKYEHGKLIWDRFISGAYGNDLLKTQVASYIKDRELLTLKNGATAQLLSSDNPQSLTGFTITLAIVDEAAFVQDAGLEHLLPCLAVRQGTLLAFGTAEGQGWHRTWYLRGQDPNYPDHWSVTYESTNNPYFPPEELETQKLLLPRRRYEQLYLARWQSEEGAVFHNIDSCIIGSLDKPEPETVEPEEGHKYVVGVDFGRHQDFTVAYVGEPRTGRVLHQMRFTQQDWMGQIERVARLAKKYNNATIICDGSGLGDVVVSELQDAGADVVSVVFTPSSKDRLIQRLVVALEREEIRFPAYPELLRELRVYETRTLTSGRVQTGAPAGFHDDCPTALALLNEGFERGYGGGSRVFVEEFAWQKR